MNNVTELRRTVHKKIISERITISLMPDDVKKRLMEAAILVRMMYGNCGLELSDDASPEAQEAIKLLNRAVTVASRYTVPTEIEVDESI